MKGYLPLSFIEEKIRDLENALFFSTSDAVLKMPPCVVRILGVDEFGQLLFTVPKPSQFIYTFENTFPARLDFFRKGKDYFLKILGKAFIVNDPEEINSIGSISEFVKSKARNNELVILKVKITHADYSEKRKEGLSGRLLTSQIKEGFRNLFRFARPTEGAFFSRIPANQLVHSPVFSN